MAGRRTDDRLSAADASNILMDAADQVNVFLLAGVLGPGGFVGDEGALDLGRLRADLAVRLTDPLVRASGRLTDRVVSHGGKLVWEPCQPNLDQHVRSSPAVAGPDGLARLCADLMTTPLPADRPLWELLVVPGASERGPGVVFRAHHAVADGVAGIRLAQLLFGPNPWAEPAPAPPRPSAPVTGGNRRRPWWRTVAGGAVRIAAVLRRSVPPTVLLGPIGPRRGVGFATVDLHALRTGAQQAGGTVNDALLAGVAAATAATLATAGERVPAVLPASVPVALPDRGRSGNAVGVMMVELPTADSEPADRVGRIAALTGPAKADARASGTFELTRSRWGSRLFARLARRQRFVALFVTNVRGPEETLVIGGAPLLQAWPVTPIQGNVRLGVSALSYAGTLSCAIHADPAALRADTLARALGEELARIGSPSH